jgi:hypothetical protein
VDSRDYRAKDFSSGEAAAFFPGPKSAFGNAMWIACDSTAKRPPLADMAGKATNENVFLVKQVNLSAFADRISVAPAQQNAPLPATL